MKKLNAVFELTPEEKVNLDKDLAIYGHGAQEIPNIGPLFATTYAGPMDPDKKTRHTYMYIPELFFGNAPKWTPKVVQWL
ncbi:hypothetical protein [Paraburkholderia sp. GAS82]|uniref:hypothetical protein n=1 Tax=Paraburkholderia sp. GAS82 TaxID=3035137 RepID=UPI003D1E6846